MKKLFVCMSLKNTKLIKGSMCKITKTLLLKSDDGKSQHNKMLFEYITINNWQVVSQLSLVFADVCQIQNIQSRPIRIANFFCRPLIGQLQTDTGMLRNKQLATVINSTILK